MVTWGGDKDFPDHLNQVRHIATLLRSSAGISIAGDSYVPWRAGTPREVVEEPNI